MSQARPWPYRGLVVACVVLQHNPASNSPPLVTIHLGVLHYKIPAASPLYVTIHLCVLQYSAHQPPQPQYTLVYCNTMAQPTNLPIAIQFSATAHPCCNIIFSYCNTLPSLTAALVTIQLLYCNTNPQPFKPLRPAVSQYNFPLYCDTVGQ